MSNKKWSDDPDIQEFYAKREKALVALKAAEEEREECLHEDIQRHDARCGQCVQCGVTFDNMDEWVEEAK